MSKYLDHIAHYRTSLNNGERFQFDNMTYIRATATSAEMVDIPIVGKEKEYITTCVVTVVLLEAGVKFFPCGDSDDVIFSDWQALVVMEYIKEQRRAMRGNGPKTFVGWQNSGLRTIEEYLVVGDQVDVDMVDHFRNILPPRTDRHTLMQAGGEYNTAKDENGCWRPTYLTFETTGDGWRYAGLCYAGERENRVDYKSSLDRRIEAVQAILVAQSVLSPAT